MRKTIKKSNKMTKDFKEKWQRKEPFRKPPRLDGKQMNRGIKNIRKESMKNK